MHQFDIIIVGRHRSDRPGAHIEHNVHSTDAGIDLGHHFMVAIDKAALAGIEGPYRLTDTDGRTLFETLGTQLRRG